MNQIPYQLLYSHMPLPQPTPSSFLFQGPGLLAPLNLTFQQGLNPSVFSNPIVCSSIDVMPVPSLVAINRSQGQNLVQVAGSVAPKQKQQQLHVKQEDVQSTSAGFSSQLLASSSSVSPSSSYSQNAESVPRRRSNFRECCSSMSTSSSTTNPMKIATSTVMMTTLKNQQILLNEEDKSKSNVTFFDGNLLRKRICIDEVEYSLKVSPQRTINFMDSIKIIPLFTPVPPTSVAASLGRQSKKRAKLSKKQNDIYLAMLEQFQVSSIVTQPSLSTSNSSSSSCSEDMLKRINQKFILFLRGKYRALKAFNSGNYSQEQLPSNVIAAIHLLIQQALAEPQQIKKSKHESDDGSDIEEDEVNHNKTYTKQKVNAAATCDENENGEDLEVTDEQIQAVQQMHSSDSQQQLVWNSTNNGQRESSLLKNSQSIFGKAAQPSKFGEQIPMGFGEMLDEQTEGKIPQQQQHEEDSANGEETAPKRKQIFHNLSKYLMHLILELISEDHLEHFEIAAGYESVIASAIRKLRESGKRNRFSQTFYFNHSHYNCLFLAITEQNKEKLRKMPEFMKVQTRVFGNIDFDDARAVLNLNIIKQAIGTMVLTQMRYILSVVEENVESSLLDPSNVQTDCQAKIAYFKSVFKGISKLLAGQYLIRF